MVLQKETALKMAKMFSREDGKKEEKS